MREKLLGSKLGQIALTLRERAELVRAAWRSDEEIGSIANDHLASELVGKLCQPGKTMIDVGAHIGSVIARVRRHSATVKIIAVEANPEKADNLRKRFPQVEVYQCALGDRSGEVQFFVNTRQSGYSSLLKPQGSAHTRQINVPMKRLDDLTRSEQADVMKIDVEGAELGVLRGAESLIGLSRPVIMFESGPEENGGYTKAAMWGWFNERRYMIFVPNRLAHDGRPLGLEAFIESHEYPRRTTNYFAVPAERRNEIRDRVRRVLKITVNPPS
jgi:FkbM family methyltransferase